jgi:hypothetical protein
MTAETRVTPWAAFGHYGLARVRIWMKRTEFGFWQRHEWERDDGSTRADRWIPSCTRSFPTNCEPATAEPSDFETLVAALARIARGHNDPRDLARETLASIGHNLDSA